ncbi:hypothetical protein E2562_022777 [Oryza meyeriana var. granulata]|uniref:Nicotianamine synthase n=1 Tax=Oryza meyeriana var. granulata TaxID=110450 RepID=A0A6G1FB95_9ORYZ|nr:hypothetical protein E2562_022777 [Oryza meyeriana var. granulata]
MEAQSQEVAALLRKIAGLHAAIAKLPSLSTSPEVVALFTELVDVAKLGPEEEQRMRAELVRLCSDAEARLEERYSDEVAAADRPLDHLGRFPYLRSYVRLSYLEHGMLARYAPGLASPARVAFVGSGPLPLGSLVLAARHMPCALFDGYDRCGAASDRARRLVRTVAAAAGGGEDVGVGARMSFRTTDVTDLQARDLAVYDVVFLAAAVGGATAAEKAVVVAHLGRHMAAGAALVVRSALCAVVEPEVVSRAGFDVLAMCHPDDEGINSVILARKAANGPRRNGNTPAPHVVSSPCGCSKADASARPRGGKGGVRKRPPRSCQLDAINETRRRAW